jgi:hypothetical protein
MNINQVAQYGLTFLPLTVFLGYARFHNWTDSCWAMAFTLSALASIISIGILVYNRIALDRLWLGIYLFLVIGAVGFLVNMENTILYWYENYKGASLFAAIALAAIVTEYMPSHLFGNNNPIYQHTKIPLFLPLAALACAVYAIIFNGYGLILSTAVPLVTLRFVNDIAKKNSIL